MQRGVEHLGLLSRSVEETRALGRAMGVAARPGDLVLLRGSFGAGKTTLVQGMAEGLDVADLVTSPSFTLINEYRGRMPVYHVDLYRLERLDEEMEQAIESCQGGEGLVIVEWPDLLPPDLREGALLVELSVAGDEYRHLILHTHGSRWQPEEVAAMVEAHLDRGPRSLEG